MNIFQILLVNILTQHHHVTVGPCVGSLPRDFNMSCSRECHVQEREVWLHLTAAIFFTLIIINGLIMYCYNIVPVNPTDDSSMCCNRYKRGRAKSAEEKGIPSNHSELLGF